MTGRRGGRWLPRYDLYDAWGAETAAAATATAATAAASAPRVRTTSAGTTSNYRRRGQGNNCAPQRCRPSGRPLAARPNASRRQTSTPPHPTPPPPHGTYRGMMPADADDGHPPAGTVRNRQAHPVRKKAASGAGGGPCARQHGRIHASTAPANTGARSPHCDACRPCGRRGGRTTWGSGRIHEWARRRVVVTPATGRREGSHLPDFPSIFLSK